jgi:hypothetical protein
MAFSSYCTTQTFPAILQCQQYVPLDTASRHAPEIQHTSLWPVPVHISECSYKWEKRVPANIHRHWYLLRCLDFILWHLDLKMKCLYKHWSFSVFDKNILVISLSSAPQHSFTLLFPTSTSDTIFHWFPAALYEEYFQATDRGLL